MSRLLVTANSPGEIAGWVRPIAHRWSALNLGPVDLLLLPCSFASGQEERVARSLPGVDRVYQTSQYYDVLRKYGADYRNGRLLHLGGDMMYTAGLSWRWRLSTWSYLWARRYCNSAFTGYFAKDEICVNGLKRRGVPPEKIFLTGDLVLDSIRDRVKEPTLEKANQLSYLPGSRVHEVKSLVPLFLAVHQKIQKNYPGLDGVLHLSPFLPTESLNSLLQSQPDPKVGGLQGHLNGEFLENGDTKLRLVSESHYQDLSRSQMALSIPGTKTAEAGMLHTPALTILPLNRPEHLPSTGLTGLLDFLPGGATIKGKILLKLKPTLGLLGHPNILADRALLPELIEEVDPTPLAELSIRLLKEKKQLRRVAEHLTNLYPWTQNPAHSVVKKLAEGLG